MALLDFFTRRSDGRAEPMQPAAIQPLAEPGPPKGGGRILVTALTLSAAGFAAWQAHEGFTETAVIPTKGDVPTIGHGSTRYEDGTRVKLGDRITRKRAAELARNLQRKDELAFAASIPAVKLTQVEYDLYINFAGQFGMGNWKRSSMRRELLAGNPAKACDGLLKYRKAAGYDCSTLINNKPNKRCWGVWTRQQERHAQCVAAVKGSLQ